VVNLNPLRLLSAAPIIWARLIYRIFLAPVHLLVHKFAPGIFPALSER
jgi:hypothetical protein